MALKKHLERENSDLKSKIAHLRAVNEQLEHRRMMDMEGFAADITMLRKKLRTIERKLLQVRQINEHLLHIRAGSHGISANQMPWLFISNTVQST